MSTQPNTPAPQAPAVAMDMNALVEVKVDGQTLREPLSKIVQSYQLAGAAQNRLAEVNKLRADLMEKTQTYSDEINFARSFKETARSDPQRLVREAIQLASQISGQRIDMPTGQSAQADSQNAQPQGDPQPQSQRDPALMQTVSQLQSQIANMQAETSVDRLTREIGTELGRYPLFSDPANPVSVEARAQAEMIVSSLRATPQYRNAPVADLVSHAHGRLQKLVTTQTQQVFDNRLATAANVPAVPTGTGTPALSNVEVPLGVKDLGGGRAKQMLSNIFRTVAPTR